MSGIDGLANEIAKALEEYSEEVEKEINKDIDQLAKEIVSELANDSAIPERTGRYKKGFYSKKTSTEKTNYAVTIANKQYQLTHLLERGHLTSTGRRTRAFPHWEKAQQKAEELEQKVIARVKR